MEQKIGVADIVRHIPSGEKWVVARVSKYHIYPAGWPPCRADVSDCELVEKASPKQIDDMLLELRRLPLSDERRICEEITKPKIVCLCGSSRFYEAYQKAEYEETMKGNIYLSIGFYPHSAGQPHGEGVGCTSEEKIALDELHKRKIDLADEVLVLNVGGYIGESTKSEVEYAKRTGKPIRWLEPMEERT